tara:strand:+ start:2250 stop:2942 length:693 start_codon:yes stop_codon:yes gene_type:complete
MISVVIPTLNEKNNIRRISDKLLNTSLIKEIIFVDDNSIDGTYKEILNIKKNKKILAIKRKNKIKDLSKSVIIGVKKAKYECICIMDCDLQHDVRYIKSMWKIYKKKKVDLVVASRFVKKSYSGNLGFIRSLLSNFAVMLIINIFGKKTTDPLSGFFLCDKKIVIDHKNRFFLKGYKILFDVLYNGKKNLKVSDLEIVFKKRNSDQSKFNLRIILIFIKQMIYTKFLAKF